MIDLQEVLETYAAGVGCGILLSLIPYVVGSVIRIALDIMKKGGF
nr:MAG TPA: hypothetical protein [Inoviridae sp.]